MSKTRLGRPLSDADVVLTALIVALTLATAYAHLTVGGLLFTLSAIAYGSGAVALVLPITVRYRRLVRILLAGYAAATITAWVLNPNFYPTGFAGRAIELAIISLLALDLVRHEADAIDRLRHKFRSLPGRRGRASPSGDPYRGYWSIR